MLTILSEKKSIFPIDYSSGIQSEPAPIFESENVDQSDVDKFLRIWHVEQMVGFKKSKIWEMVRKKQFPIPMRLHIPSVTVWRQSAIVNWMKQQPNLSESEIDVRP